MTLTTELKKMREQTTVLPLDWLIATGQEVTEEKIEAIQKAAKYQNREKMPEPYLWMSDLYNELTGQEPTKRVFMDWMQTFEEWKQEGLQVEHIRAAFLKANDNIGGFTVGRPGALTNTAVGMKTKLTKTVTPQVNTEAITYTQKLLAEKYDHAVFVPRPASVARPTFKRPENERKVNR
jgi:hypothetical protein